MHDFPKLHLVSHTVLCVKDRKPSLWWVVTLASRSKEETVGAAGRKLCQNSQQPSRMTGPRIWGLTPSVRINRQTKQGDRPGLQGSSRETQGGEGLSVVLELYLLQLHSLEEGGLQSLPWVPISKKLASPLRVGPICTPESHPWEQRILHMAIHGVTPGQGSASRRCRFAFPTFWGTTLFSEMGAEVN